MSAATSLQPAVADPPTLKALYQAHLDDVWRVLERLGVPPAHLEDAVQETFIIAHRQLPTFRGEGTARAWLVGIAVRVAKDARRHHARKSSWESLDAHADVAAPGTPDEAAMHRQALRKVMRLLERLPSEQRELLVLVELEGLTAPEVAEATSVPLNTVYSRLRAARARFEELLEGTDPGAPR